jgi:hypothetical protein
MTAIDQTSGPNVRLFSQPRPVMALGELGVLLSENGPWAK